MILKTKPDFRSPAVVSWLRKFKPFPEGLLQLMKHSEPDPIDRYLDRAPEPKLELIDGRLVVGNSLAGSRFLLHEILTGWGADAALPMAAQPLWFDALSLAFQPPRRLASLPDWQTWAAQVVYQPEIAPAGPRADAGHYHASSELHMGLFAACERGHFGSSLGRDFVMRLGWNGFTPDVLLIGAKRLEALKEYYLDGPADLVIEVLMPGHEAQDREVKRGYYAAGRVAEYWLVNSATRSVELLRWVAGEYQPRAVDAEGRYCPASVPGLAFVPARLWASESKHSLRTVFEVEQPGPESPGARRRGQADELEWDHLPFEPRVALQPEPIGFGEYIAWCPEAKFESYDGRPIIAGRIGTRNVLGMLLLTFGLVEAVRVLHPREWVSALAEAEAARQRDAQQKAEWWLLARRAAMLLRKEHGASRVAVIGDLVHEQPLNIWSAITLVTWDLPRKDVMSTYQALYELSREPPIELVDAESASASERRAIASEAVELP